MTRKFTLEVAGGFAATIAVPPTVVDENDLDDDARVRLQELLVAADDDDARADADAPGPLRDARSYRITVEDAAGSSFVLSATDGSVSPQFARLRDWIRQEAGDGPA